VAAEPAAAETPHPERTHRLRWLLIGVGALLLLLIGAAVAVSWHFSSMILEPDHSGGPYDLEIQAFDGDAWTIGLPRRESTERPGVYGLEWEGGSAQIGAVTATDDDAVTREVDRLEGPPPAEGEKARIYSGVFQGSPKSALNIPFTDVGVEGELGSFPAWRVDPAEDAASVVGPGAGRTWAILVHGINGSPREGLRILPALRESGLTSLLTTYREDVGAPSSEDGLHHMGQTEWKDTEAAAQYALDHGAERLVMVGFSMGGAVVTQFMENSPLAADVDAMILDAPALEWKSIIDFSARELGLPGWTAKPVEWMVGLRIDADWGRLDALRHTDQLAVPTLLFHGAEDNVVPIETSEEFAAALPDSVTFHRVADAGHVQSWNVNPRRYDRRVERWIRANRLVGGRRGSALLSGNG
jgi:uncharacterized protein